MYSELIQVDLNETDAKMCIQTRACEQMYMHFYMCYTSHKSDKLFNTFSQK